MRASKVHRRAAEAYEDTISDYITNMEPKELIEYIEAIFLKDMSPWDSMDKDIAISCVVQLLDNQDDMTLEKDIVEHKDTYESLATELVNRGCFKSREDLESFVNVN